MPPPNHVKPIRGEPRPKQRATHGNFSERQFYGNPHQDVSPNRSYQTNRAIYAQYGTDGNGAMMEQMYGPQAGSSKEIERTIQKFVDSYGSRDAMFILDELIRVGAQGDEGKSFESVNPKMHDERTNYGIARQYPSDGNLHTYEQHYGYPPSVAPNPPANQTPFFMGQRPDFGASQRGPVNAFAAAKPKR